jgi:hypothetical protein
MLDNKFDFSITPELIGKSKNEIMYVHLLDLPRFPDSPEVIVKDKIFLHPDLLGNFGPAMLATKIDKRERSQSISINEKTSSVYVTPIIIGNEYSMGAKASFQKLSRFMHITQKTLIDFHTHPKNFWIQSYQDVASARAFPRVTYMHMVGSDSGIFALLQTNKALSVKNLPTTLFDDLCVFLQKNNWPIIKPELAGSLHYYLGDSSPEELSRLASIVNELGFACYEWSAPNGVIRENDLINGIVLNRVK